MSDIYNCCSLCLKEDKNNGDGLIWRDGLQLCQACYEKYTKNAYNEKTMLMNAIKKYRREIDIYQETEYEYENEIKRLKEIER